MGRKTGKEELARVRMDSGQHIRIGAVMLVCMVILGGLISRMKIAQALKLGED